MLIWKLNFIILQKLESQMIFSRFNNMKRTDKRPILDSIDLTLVITNWFVNNGLFLSSHVFFVFRWIVFHFFFHFFSTVICSSTFASSFSTVSKMKFCRIKLWILFVISCAFFFGYFSHLKSLRTLHCLIKFNITVLHYLE